MLSKVRMSFLNRQVNPDLKQDEGNCINSTRDYKISNLLTIA